MKTRYKLIGIAALIVGIVVAIFKLYGVYNPVVSILIIAVGVMSLMLLMAVGASICANRAHELYLQHKGEE